MSEAHCTLGISDRALWQYGDPSAEVRWPPSFLPKPADQGRDCPVCGTGLGPFDGMTHPACRDDFLVIETKPC